MIFATFITNHQYFYAHAKVAVGMKSVNGNISSINPTVPMILLSNILEIKYPLFK